MPARLSQNSLHGRYRRDRIGSLKVLWGTEGNVANYFKLDEDADSMLYRNSKWKLSAAAVVMSITSFLASSWAAGAKPAKPGASPAKLKAYPSRYYVIHTDLGDEVAAEASARMTAMAEEYHERTRGFAGMIRHRLPFYLFGRAADYRAAGGLPASAGQSDGRRRVLMALAGKRPSLSLWHTIQHEGFHQFVDLAIGGRVPIWINEGLAEYFGAGIWTGDSFVTGIIASRRLEAVKQHIKNSRIIPFSDFLAITGDQWLGAFDQRQKDGHKSESSSKTGRSKSDADTPKVNRVRINYDQAWSMVHFLIHAEGGRYRKSFAGLISDISAGTNWRQSFRKRFGTNIEAFQKRYCDWWLGLPSDATRDLTIKAHLATLTSFLARATSQGQSFPDVAQFLSEARGGRLKSHPAQRLPDSLLERSLVDIRGWNRGWRFDDTGRGPIRLVLAWPDGTTFTGSFTIGGGKCGNVKVTVTRPRPQPEPEQAKRARP